jgi:hypothetical protein
MEKKTQGEEGGIIYPSSVLTFAAEKEPLLARMVYIDTSLKENNRIHLHLM